MRGGMRRKHLNAQTKRIVLKLYLDPHIPIRQAPWITSQTVSTMETLHNVKHTPYNVFYVDPGRHPHTKSGTSDGWHSTVTERTTQQLHGILLMAALFS